MKWIPLAFERPEYAIAREIGPVFRRQFILSDHPIVDDNEFVLRRFAGRYLYVGEALNVSQCVMSDFEVVFLGIGVDPDGHVITDARLQDIMQIHCDLEAAANFLSGCGGRYAFMIFQGGECRFYVDPTAMLSAAYEGRRGVVASVATLAVSGPVEPSDDFPDWESIAHGEKGRFAFGYTLDRRVRQLLPNRYLDLNRWTEFRHWPIQDADFTCTTLSQVHQTVEDVYKRHVQIISAISTEFPTALPVSGGQDSRLLLAFAKPSKANIDFVFTHITNMISGRDNAIAKELCARVGFDHTTLRVLKRIRHFLPAFGWEAQKRRAALRQGVLVGDGTLNMSNIQKREMSAAHAIPDDHVVLRGHVTDISKAVLWRGIGNRAFSAQRDGPVPTDVAVKLMLMGGPQGARFFGARYHEWLNTIERGARRRSIDLMGVEQYRPYSLGIGFNGYENHFFLSPGNDRLVISALMRIPPDMRTSLHINDMLIQRAAPELLDLDFVRASDNSLRQSRSEVETYLDTY